MICLSGSVLPLASADFDSDLPLASSDWATGPSDFLDSSGHDSFCPKTVFVVGLACFKCGKTARMCECKKFTRCLSPAQEEELLVLVDSLRFNWEKAKARATKIAAKRAKREAKREARIEAGFEADDDEPGVCCDGFKKRCRK